MAKFERLSMVILLQSDVETAVDFYTQLGLTKIFHIPGKWAEMKLGEIKIGLCPSSAQLPLRNSGLVIEVDSVSKFYETHKEFCTFLAEPKEALHGVMASLQDPGMNIIDIYQPTPARLQEALQKAACDLEADGEQGCCKQTQKSCASESC